MDRHSRSIFTQTQREKWSERERGGNANISAVLWMCTEDDGCRGRLSAAGEDNAKPWVAVWAEGERINYKERRQQ